MSLTPSGPGAVAQEDPELGSSCSGLAIGVGTFVFQAIEGNGGSGNPEGTIQEAEIRRLGRAVPDVGHTSVCRCGAKDSTYIAARPFRLTTTN